MVAAHVFVDQLDAPVVPDADRHHLERVLRLRVGEEVSVSDGAGGVRLCVVREGLALEPVGDVVRDATRPAPALTVAFALVKGDRPEWIVQKLTELGVDRIVPFVADRGIVRWEVAKAARNIDRLRRVAREAAMQSRRRWLPDVVGLVPFATAVDILRPVGAALAEMDGSSLPSLSTPAVLVGPEGGWSEAELAVDLPRVRLAPTVLRAETAAVAAGAVLVALRDGLSFDR